MRILLATVCALSLVTSIGCRGCDADPSALPTGPEAPDKPVAAGKTKAPAVLIGSVRLAPGVQLPSYSATDMERKVLDHLERGSPPDVCSPPKIVDRTPVRLTPDGKLVGMMVAVSEFSRMPERAPRIHDVVIKDCRLTPALVVAMKGDTLRIRNEINFPFMPSVAQEQRLETLMPGQTKEVPLQESGVSIVLCGFTAPCGRTDLVVLHHPLYAVTGEDGNFRIENFPADETVNLNNWHPLFESAQLELRLQQGETKTVELVVTAAVPQPSAATPATDDKPAAPAAPRKK